MAGSGVPALSEFKTVLAFERRAMVSDDFGNEQAGDWQELCRRSCAIRPLKGGERVIAGRLEGQVPALIFVRLDEITKQARASWRLRNVESGEFWAVRSAADMEQKRRFITMSCESGVAFDGEIPA